jgi:hypothetical protein
MTVEEAIKALQENAECFSYDVPPKIFEQSAEDTASILMFSRTQGDRTQEDYQRRTNEEWSELVQEESDPLHVAKLLLDWINDRAQALTEFECYVPPPPSRSAPLEALDRESLPELRRLLRSPSGEAFERLLRDKYLPRPESEGASLQPDCQEAQEAATADEKRMEAAAWTWARLSDQERQILQEVTDRICGDGEGEELADELEIRLP